MPSSLSATTLDLLQDPYAFTQTKLLTPEQFMREARKRGLRLRRGHLELLHRRRVLQPFFKVHSRPVTNPRPSYTLLGFFDSALHEVRSALAEGRLSDPANRRFATWPRVLNRPSLWYSYNQLLALRSIRYLQPEIRTTRTVDDLVFQMGPLDTRTKEVFASERSLAFLVEALTTKYRPQIVGSVRMGLGDEQALFHFLDSDDDPPALRGIDLPSEMLERQADGLLFDAHSFDPLGDWSQVVRIAFPERWADLRYDALIAHDYRTAAELLLRYVEERARKGGQDSVEELPTVAFHPHQERLRVDDRERATTVMRFGVSDRPGVVLAVEGSSEYAIAPRVLAMFGYDPSASRIGFVNLEGIHGDLKLLARAVAVPRLDIEGGRYINLFSPLTTLMVVVDPEVPFESPNSAEVKKNEMIESVLNSLLPSLRSDAMRNDLAEILHVHRWPAEFEFAHWTNSELAEALQEISQHASEIPRDELVNRIGKHRDAVDTLKSVWKNWPRKPSKLKLANALWPTLESRIRTTSEPAEIPIVRVIQEAISIVHQTQRVTAMAPNDPSP